MMIGTKVQGQYRGITISGVIGFIDKEDYGVTLDRPTMIDGTMREKVLVPVTPFKRASKPTWIKGV